MSNSKHPFDKPSEAWVCAVKDDKALSVEEQRILKLISNEIEQRFNCKVVAINFCLIIGTPNVQVKIQYNDDFIYKPCENWTPESIVFSERSVRFFRRIDFFDCIKSLSAKN